MGKPKIIFHSDKNANIIGQTSKPRIKFGSDIENPDVIKTKQPAYDLGGKLKSPTFSVPSFNTKPKITEKPTKEIVRPNFTSTYKTPQIDTVNKGIKASKLGIISDREQGIAPIHKYTPEKPEINAFKGGLLSKLPVTGMMVSDEEEQKYKDLAKVILKTDPHKVTIPKSQILGTVSDQSFGVAPEHEYTDFQLGQTIGTAVKWYSAWKLAGMAGKVFSPVSKIAIGDDVYTAISSPMVRKFGEPLTRMFRNGSSLATFSAILGLSEDMTIEERQRDIALSAIFGIVFGETVHGIKKGVDAFSKWKSGVYYNHPEIKSSYLKNAKNYEEAKKLHRELSLKLHPDKGGSTEAMAQLNAEWELWKKSIEELPSIIEKTGKIKEVREIVSKLKATPKTAEVKNSIKVYDEIMGVTFKETGGKLTTDKLVSGLSLKGLEKPVEKVTEKAIIPAFEIKPTNKVVVEPLKLAVADKTDVTPTVSTADKKVSVEGKIEPVEEKIKNIEKDVGFKPITKKEVITKPEVQVKTDTAKLEKSIEILNKNIKELPIDLRKFAKEEVTSFTKILSEIKKGKPITKKIQKRIDRFMEYSEKAKDLERQLRREKLTPLQAEKLKGKKDVLETKAIEQAKATRDIKKLEDKILTKKETAKLVKIEKDIKFLSKKSKTLANDYKTTVRSIIETLQDDTLSNNVVNLKQANDIVTGFIEKDPSYEVTPKLKKALKELNGKKISELTLADRSVLTSLAKHIGHLNKSVNKIISKDREAKLDKTVNDSKGFMESRKGHKPKVTDPLNMAKEKALDSKLVKLRRKLLTSGALQPRVLASAVLNYNEGSEAYKILVTDLNTGIRTSYDLRYKYGDKYSQLFAGEKVPDKYYLSKMKKLQKNLEKDAKKIIKIAGVKITNGQAIGLYTNLLAEENTKIIDEFGLVSENKEKIKVPIDIEKFKKELPLDLKRKAEALVKFFNEDETVELINEVSNKDFGYDIIDKTKSTYVPIKRSGAFLSDNVDAVGKRNLGKLSFLQPRTGGEAPIVIRNYLDMFTDHLKDVTDYVAFRLPSKNLKLLLENKVFKDALIDNFGQDYYDEWVKYYDQMNGVTEQLSILDKGITGLQKSVTKAILGVNLPISGYQFGSIFTAIPYYSADVWAKGVATKCRLSMSDISKKCGIIRTRWEGHITRESGEAVDALGVTKLTKQIHKINTTKLITAVDNFTIRRLWNMSEIEALENGLAIDTPEFDEYVVTKTLSALSTQPNYILTERSGILRSQKATYRILTAFSTFTNTMHNLVFYAGDKYYQHKTKANRDFLIKTIAGILLSQAYVFSIRKKVTKMVGDEFDNIKELLRLAVAPVYGARDIVTLISSNYYYKTGDLVLGAIVDFIRDVESFGTDLAIDADPSTDEKDMKQPLVGHLKDIFSSGGKLMGVSAYNVEKLAKGILYTIDPYVEYTYNEKFKSTRTIKNDLYKVLLEQANRYKENNTHIDGASVKFLEQFKNAKKAVNYLRDYGTKEGVPEETISKIEKWLNENH